MNEDTFLAEVFRKKDTVTVNANELQKILQDKRRTAAELVRLSKRITELNNALESVQMKLDCEILTKPMYVDLKV